MSITITNKTIDKFFGFLTNLDNSSKKKLIIKLTESIELKEVNNINLNSLFGAWKGDKSSDEIIHEIRESRIDKRNIIDF